MLMRYRLRQRAYTCLDLNGWDRSSSPARDKYDVISCLNVLDRCACMVEHMCSWCGCFLLVSLEWRLSS